MDRTDHTVFMKEAIRLAQEAASAGEVPIGALVVHQGVIIGQGRNTREMTQDATGHAEMEAIRTACRARASLVSIRRLSRSAFALSRIG